MTTQPAPSIENRLPLWGIVLVLASFEDLALTLIALGGFARANELNPIAAVAITQGFVAALLLKVAGLTLALALAVLLQRSGHAEKAQRTLAWWSIGFLVLNAYSAFQLLGVA